MAEFKKKKVKKVKLGKVPSKRRNPKEKETFDIPMTKESKEKVEKNKNKPKKVNNKKTDKPIIQKPFKILKGNKSKLKKKSSIITYSCIAVVLIIVLINYLTPTGLIETFNNKISQAGSGEIPVTLQSSNILSTFGDDNRAFVLSDTNFEIYNSRGKCLNVIQHGFLKPAMSVSENRSLIYDRGGKNYKILNNSEVLYSDSLKNNIYSADISRSGVFGISSKSSGYSSELKVFNKYNKPIYTLFSAENIIADLVLNDSGKKVATSEITVSGGEYVSIINVYSFDSSSPKYSFKIEGEAVASIINLNSCFAVVGKNNISIINWSNGSKTDCVVNGEVLNYCYDLDGNFAYVSGRNNDYSINNITYYRSNKMQNSFNVNYLIKSISISGRNIYTLNSENINCYNGNNGKKIESLVSEFTSSDMFAISKNSVATISQTKLFVLK